MPCPDALLGMVIGLNGQKRNEWQKKFNVSIATNDNKNTCKMKSLMITGFQEQVLRAETHIGAFIDELKEQLKSDRDERVVHGTRIVLGLNQLVGVISILEPQDSLKARIAKVPMTVTSDEIDAFIRERCGKSYLRHQMFKETRDNKKGVVVETQAITA